MYYAGGRESAIYLGVCPALPFGDGLANQVKILLVKPLFLLTIWASPLLFFSAFLLIFVGCVLLIFVDDETFADLGSRRHVCQTKNQDARGTRQGHRDMCRQEKEKRELFGA